MTVALTTGGLFDVTYYEVPDLYAETWRPDGSSAVRGCRVQWSQREKFVLDMLGRTESGTDADTGKLFRRLPRPHPVYAGMYATDCTLQDKLGVPNQDPLGKITFDERTAAGELANPGGGDGSGWAVYAVTYARPNFRVLADEVITSERERFVIKQYKFSIENLTFPGQSFVWGANGSVGLPADNPGKAVPASQAGQPLQADITKAFPTNTIIYQWLQLPDIPASRIAAGLGKVNSAAWDGYGAETLLLQSVDVEPKQHANSRFYWQCSYQMLFRSSGWNKIYNRAAGNLLPVVNKVGTEPSIYDTYDFDLLFKLA